MDDRTNLHLLLNIAGCLLSLIAMIALAVFMLHAQNLVPSIEFREKTFIHYFTHGIHLGEVKHLQICLDFFESVAWNVVSLITLIVCFICHATFVGFILLNKIEIYRHEGNGSKVPSIKIKEESEKPKKKVSINENQNRIRIPSSRNYPSSPIVLDPLSLTPLQERKTTL